MSPAEIALTLGCFLVLLILTGTLAYQAGQRKTEHIPTLVSSPLTEIQTQFRKTLDEYVKDHIYTCRGASNQVQLDSGAHFLNRCMSLRESYRALTGISHPMSLNEMSLKLPRLTEQLEPEFEGL